MLNKIELSKIPPEFHNTLGKAVEIILTGRFYDVAVTPTSVSANSTSEQTFTARGLLASDIVVVNKPSHQTGLGIVGARASATDTIAITYMNNTGGGITPTSETYEILAIRRERE